MKLRTLLVRHVEIFGLSFFFHDFVYDDIYAMRKKKQNSFRDGGDLKK